MLTAVLVDRNLDVLTTQGAPSFKSTFLRLTQAQQARTEFFSGAKCSECEGPEVKVKANGRCRKILFRFGKPQKVDNEFCAWRGVEL